MGRNLQRMIRVAVGPRGTLTRVFGNAEDGSPGHHVEFSTQAGDEGQAGECNLTIYNLNEQSLALFEDPKHVVQIRAGYRDAAGAAHQPNPAVVFSGSPDPAKLKYAKQGGDWALSVLVRDGGHALDYGRLDRSYARGISLAQLAADATKAAGLSVGKVAVGSQTPYLSRAVFSAPVREILDLITARVGKGTQWFVRDGAVYVMGREDTTPERAVVFSSEAGNLLDPPSRLEEGGIEFRGILEPSIRVGCVVKVESIKITEFYRVTAVSFSADNYGGDFSVTIRGVKRG